MAFDPKPDQVKEIIDYVLSKWPNNPWVKRIAGGLMRLKEVIVLFFLINVTGADVAGAIPALVDTTRILMVGPAKHCAYGTVASRDEFLLLLKQERGRNCIVFLNSSGNFHAHNFATFAPANVAVENRFDLRDDNPRIAYYAEMGALEGDKERKTALTLVKGTTNSAGDSIAIKADKSIGLSAEFGSQEGHELVLLSRYEVEGLRIQFLSNLIIITTVLWLLWCMRRIGRTP